MANFKPIDDASIERLYGAVMGRSVPSPAVRESIETQKLKEQVLYEIENFKEDARTLQLGHALGLEPRGYAYIGDAALMKLYRAVR